MNGRNALALVLIFGFVTVAANSALADAWNEYPYLADGFAISGPAAPLRSDASDSGTAALPLLTRTLIWKATDGLVLIAASTVATNGWGSDSAEPMDNVLAGELGSLTGGRVVSKKPIVLPGLSGIDCVLEGSLYHGRTRIMRQGNHMWTLLALDAASKPISDEADRFFASFRLIAAANLK